MDKKSVKVVLDISNRDTEVEVTVVFGPEISINYNRLSSDQDGFLDYLKSIEYFFIFTAVEMRKYGLQRIRLSILIKESEEDEQKRKKLHGSAE